MSSEDHNDWAHDREDHQAHGYRMVIFVIHDQTMPGGIDLRTALVTGTMETCQTEVNRVLSIYRQRVFGWKITDILPIPIK